MRVCRNATVRLWYYAHVFQRNLPQHFFAGDFASVCSSQPNRLRCLFSQTAYPLVSHNCKQPTTFLGESIEFMHTHAYICWQLQRRKIFGFSAWKAKQSLVTISWCRYASPWFKITRNYASPNWSPDDERTELRMQIGFVNAYSNVKYRTEVRQDQCARPS